MIIGRETMEYKFVAVSYGKVKLPRVGWEPVELTDLNYRLAGIPSRTVLSEYIKQGWSIKQFFIHTTNKGRPVFILLLERGASPTSSGLPIKTSVKNTS
jgi:hypothetical protein